ncbi:MAG: hypothetical protein JNL67_07335 [Planctomycetaceae bacterium]|nr:hypothetical protein [Planctomycetaceae bacterium]
MMRARWFGVLVLAVFAGLPNVSIGQDSGLTWKDGVLYSIAPDGRTTVIGSISGFIEEKLPDGTTGLIRTKQISPDFNPIPQENETEEMRKQRREIESLQGAAAEIGRVIGEQYDFGSEKRLTNDGLVFLIYERELATSLLDLSATQIGRVEEVAKFFNGELEKIRKRNSPASNDQQSGELASAELLVELKNRAIADLSDNVLLPRQIRVANLQGPANSGVIRKIARTPVGAAIGLSPSQQQNISVGVAEISLRVQEQLEKARRDVEDLLGKELEESQLKRLEEFYPGILKHQIRLSSVEQLLRYLDFQPQARGK